MITNPTDLHPAWAAAFNAADVDGMLALAEPGSGFAPQPGTVVTGDDYRAALGGFLAMGLPISLTLKHSLVSGDIALLIYDWTIAGTAADGSEVSMSGTTADVARLGEQGWKYVLDNPFGTA
ncbi:nuclear transport factor 2 family protein [Cellulomonas sp. NPDC089187]|uniref:YybH family protein n=1 Tax=Cellulomonas sp. NPDC089187 TaxID=3154970 RepID=UPI003445239E